MPSGRCLRKFQASNLVRSCIDWSFTESSSSPSRRLPSLSTGPPGGKMRENNGWQWIIIITRITSKDSLDRNWPVSVRRVLATINNKSQPSDVFCNVGFDCLVIAWIRLRQCAGASGQGWCERHRGENRWRNRHRGPIRFTLLLVMWPGKDEHHFTAGDCRFELFHCLLVGQP